MDENIQLCRICISNSECATMIPIFGDDLLWKKITTLADVKIEKGDTLPQQVCMACAKTAINACMFKKKCEDADNFFRHHLQMMRRMEHRADVITISESSDNEPTEDMAGGGNMMGDFPNMMLMNGNNSSGALDQMDYKNVDLNSIRLMMNNYLMEQQAKEADAMAACNGIGSGAGFAPSCDMSMDDEHLPLIPEIELITPHDDGNNRHDVNGQLHGFQCSICYQLFDMKQLLKDHMQSCHGRSAPVYECLNCKKTYLYKRFLEKHVRRGRCVKKRRNQTRPMQCTDCHVLFPTGHHLGWHKRTGCPSRAAKVPLQQLFKQNIVQYNNFPKPVIPPRKPDNAFYIHNRRIFVNNSKRKGRTRIKLDATKIALAKQLILKEATTTQIAQELSISRTFAWRLRKNLVNGVSLYERLVDQSGEEIQQPDIEQTDTIAETSTAAVEQINLSIKTEQTEKEEEIAEPSRVRESNEIKQELNDDDDDEDNDDDEEDDDDDDDDNDDEDDDDSDDSDDDDDEEEDTTKSNSEQNNSQSDMKPINHELNYEASYAKGGHSHLQQMELTNYQNMQHTASSTTGTVSNQMNNMHNENAASSGEDDDDDDDDDDEEEDEDDDDDDDDDEEDAGGDETQQNEDPMQRFKQHLFQTLPAVFQIPQPGYQLPVNLSIKPSQTVKSSGTVKVEQAPTKKPRKPNVFIDDEKYETAKILVSQNSSTMEIARQLNVSQMTAWKLRDAIVKGIPLSYRSKREARPKPPEQHKLPMATSTPKANMPRRRLKAAERELRDKEITREILEMIKEDSNIQYWKVSARLAEKGYSISPSSVCQKLKALGIHRRWKPGDKPPMLDMENLKTSGGFGGGTSTDSFEFNNEQQFEFGGAHFLSAFTH